MDKQYLRFVKAETPILEPVTKLGGQPVWLEEPTWPLSAKTGNPMRFIGQIALPGDRPRLAYLFMTEDEDAWLIERTWETDAGENAFFAQPGRPASLYDVRPLSTGPTHGPDHLAVPTSSEETSTSFVGGAPKWLQGEETPTASGPWEHTLQLDSCDVPFPVNFGDAGIGYAFLNPHTGEGRFLWQCC
ncbi:YwqG family protein [Nocardiopsis halophila]|uniref:hypothetical protein n=1 Tax=Nocardiopsis halophila TaxID=141692 RepID=UPI000349A60F|nr:hypothetical protein [Nocardiopsis halophila]